jgi:hypothetical protein
MFQINLTLPSGYPFKPPTISFATKIYHPNVSNDDKGSMCLGMLKSDEWKPSSRIMAVLEFARQLLAEPMPDDAVEGRIAEQYKNDYKRYEEVARDWTRKYAKSTGWFLSLLTSCVFLPFPPRFPLFNLFDSAKMRGGWVEDWDRYVQIRWGGERRKKKAFTWRYDSK